MEVEGRGKQMTESKEGSEVGVEREWEGEGRINLPLIWNPGSARANMVYEVTGGIVTRFALVSVEDAGK